MAIITGGAQGIGGATARRLAADGARTLIVDVDVAQASANVARIQAAGGTARLMEGNVAEEATAREMVEVARGE